jgi:hypothetical protein
MTKKKGLAQVSQLAPTFKKCCHALIHQWGLQHLCLISVVQKHPSFIHGAYSGLTLDLYSKALSLCGVWNSLPFNSGTQTLICAVSSALISVIWNVRFTLGWDELHLARRTSLDGKIQRSVVMLNCHGMEWDGFCQMKSEYTRLYLVKPSQATPIWSFISWHVIPII